MVFGVLMFSDEFKQRRPGVSAWRLIHPKCGTLHTIQRGILIALARAQHPNTRYALSARVEMSKIGRQRPRMMPSVECWSGVTAA